MSMQTPLMQRLAQWLGSRRNRLWLRYKDDISPRTIPKPNIPPGVNSKLSDNYYCTRDARRDMMPPAVTYNAGVTTKQLKEGQRTTGEEKVRLPTPGFSPQWTLSKDEPHITN